MKTVRSCALLAGALAFAFAPVGQRLARITIDCPSEESLFPPEFPAPAFAWRDGGSATRWTIEVRLAGRPDAIRIQAPGERMRVGTIDPRAVAPTNAPPKLTAEQAAARTWRPDAATWAAIKRVPPTVRPP